jgi:hypothetical protein
MSVGMPGMGVSSNVSDSNANVRQLNTIELTFHYLICFIKIKIIVACPFFFKRDLCCCHYFDESYNS